MFGLYLFFSFVSLHKMLVHTNESPLAEISRCMLERDKIPVHTGNPMKAWHL